MRRVSLVVTVRNDREGLEVLLPALARQTYVPDELIVVDGGSRDDTLGALDIWRSETAPLRVVVAPGANIAAGRNVGVRTARNEWIACTDAGCRPDPEWLERLAQTNAPADIVAGIFIAEGETPLERVVALTHYPSPRELDRPGPLVRLSHRIFGRSYLARHAGGRSMAFSRSVWDATGGFPEGQYAGEDLAFTAAAIEHGFRATLAPDAVVRWRPPPTWRANARMFFTYCRGDIRSKGRWRHLVRLTAWLAAPVLVIAGGWPGRLVVLAGALAYVGLPLQRAWAERLQLRHWWRIPAAVAVKDISQLAGAGAGLIDALRGVAQPNPQPPP